MKVSALGSYPRIGEGAENQKLRRGIQQYQAGKISDKDLRAIQEQVTIAVLREQEEAGLDWVTDGLIRWEDGQTYFTDRLSGFHRRNLLRYFDTNTYFRQPVCDGPVRWSEPITVADYEFASRQTPLPVRPVVTGPFTLATLSLDEHYQDRSTYIADLTTALNQELKALASAGAETIQVDEPVLTRYSQDARAVQEVFGKLVDGVEKPVWVALYMGPVVQLLDQIGSWPVAGVWLDCISDPDTIHRLSEEPFAEGKQLGLGIVNARNTKLETEDEILGRLTRVADKTPLDRLAVTTSAGLEFLPRDSAQRKLKRMSEAVRSFQQ